MVTYTIFNFSRPVKTGIKTLDKAKKDAKRLAETTKSPHNILKVIGTYTGENNSKYRPSK